MDARLQNGEGGKKRPISTRVRKKKEGRNETFNTHALSAPENIAGRIYTTTTRVLVTQQNSPTAAAESNVRVLMGNTWACSFSSHSRHIFPAWIDGEGGEQSHRSTTPLEGGFGSVCIRATGPYRVVHLQLLGVIDASKVTFIGYV